MKIGVVTATRAEYGLLKPLIRKIQNDPETELALFVTGTHLMQEYGYTARYIEEDGFPIAENVYVDIDTSAPSSISKTMGRYFMAFADIFQKHAIDFLIVLGDRYELIPICYCAVNAQIPIGHISGGEVTEGAIDDAVRHCVTKLSYLHFPACELYRKRIIQLGEAPERVFNVGDPGVENVRKMPLLKEARLRELIGLASDIPFYVVVFHPVTLDKLTPEVQIRTLLKALDEFNDTHFVLTRSNADVGGELINQIIEQYVANHNNCVFCSSMRIEEFLSLQKYSLGLIGNSSSGIVETPCFGIPTINIGDRQKGRLMADSIINCSISAGEIVEAINLSMTAEFRKKAKNTVNPYGSGETSSEILDIIKMKLSVPIDLKKSFYDI